jgi:small-conductance mechanosensitive channel
MLGNASIDMIQLGLQAGLLFDIMSFLAVIVVGAILTRVVLMPATASLVKRRGGDEKARGSAENIAALVGLTFSLVFALQAGDFGNLVTVIGTIAAAATVAIGFGMRDQISNLMAGIFLHLDTPFLKGDYIETEGVEGTVKAVKLRSTVLDDGREKKLVPNAQLTTKVARNRSKGQRTHMSFQDKFSYQQFEEADVKINEALEDLEPVKKVETSVADVEDGKAVLRTSFSVKRSEDPVKARDRVGRKYVEAVKDIKKEEEEESAVE